jgi:hypothetical protein
MTRPEAIQYLATITLGENVGIGGYSASASYKLANGDIGGNTSGLDADTREAVAIVGSLEWSEIATGTIVC